MKKLNAAIWGLGRAGIGMHIPELQKFPDKFNIYGGYDIIPERMDAAAEKAPGFKKFASAEELLADPNVDIIAVAVPSKLHVDYDIRVLEAGKYLFAEKPVALCYADALRLKAASEKHPGKLFCRHNRRFEACFHHVREIIDSGILGEVYEIKLRRNNYQVRCDWQALTSCGGGQLNNWGPHLVDHALQFLGGSVESVFGDLHLTAAAGDAEDHVKAVLRGKTGLVVDIEISGGVTQPPPVYEVYGKLGTLVSRDEKEITIKYLDVANSRFPKEASPETPPFSGSFGGDNKLEFKTETFPVAPKSGANVNDIYGRIYDCIVNGVPFPVKPEEAFEVVRVTEMIRKASVGIH